MNETPPVSPVSMKSSMQLALTQSYGDIEEELSENKAPGAHGLPLPAEAALAQSDLMLGGEPSGRDRSISALQLYGGERKSHDSYGTPPPSPGGMALRLANSYEGSSDGGLSPRGASPGSPPLPAQVVSPPGGDTAVIRLLCDSTESPDKLAAANEAAQREDDHKARTEELAQLSLGEIVEFQGNRSRSSEIDLEAQRMWLDEERQLVLQDAENLRRMQEGRDKETAMQTFQVRKLAFLTEATAYNARLAGTSVEEVVSSTTPHIQELMVAWRTVSVAVSETD